MTPQPSEQPTPRTAAGRKLLTYIKAAAGDDGYWWEDILAIEAEASATELTGDGTGTALPAAPDPVASPDRLRSAAIRFLAAAQLESMTKAPEYIRAKRALRAALKELTDG